MTSGEVEQLVRPKPTTYDIPELVRLAVTGAIRVPSFQRSFVWDAEDVRNLFDSIWRGFPVGTLLLWRNKADESEVSFGPIRLKVSPRTEALWVVDGQQRLTSLVGVLSDMASGVDERFEVVFDLRRGRFITAGKRPHPPTWLPLRVALETRTLLGWLREHEPDLEPSDFDVADALGGALRDYQIPAYIVESDDDYLLRDVFDRVNSAGKPIGRAEVFHALFAREAEPGSPATVVESLARMQFGRLDPDRIVQSLLAIRGGNVQRDVHDEFARDEDPAEWYDLTEQALAKSIDFLRSEGIPHLLLVPSTFPLPVLATFFHLHPDPEPWISRLLARWLWRGWVHGFGRSGQTPALRQAVQALNPKKGDPSAAPGEYDAVRALLALVADEPPPTMRIALFRSDTALGRLALLALASLNPLRRDGAPVDVAQALQDHGIAAVTEFVRGRRGELAARGFWPVDALPPTGDEAPEILQSHGIVSEAADALRAGNVDAFLEARRNLLSNLIHRFLEVRVEAKALIRPPLADLIVGDEPDNDLL